MKKLRLALTAVTCSLIAITNAVCASKCGTTELSQINQDASKVKLTYEESFKKIPDEYLGESDTGGKYDVTVPYFIIKIINVTDNLYIEVTNSVDKTMRAFTSRDAVDGVISFEWDNVTDISNLTIKVFTGENTSCPHEEIYTDHKTLPKYNQYSSTDACISHPEADICKKFVTEEVTYEDYAEFNDKVKTEEIEKAAKKVEDKNKDSKAIEFVKKNKVGFIIGGSIIIVAGVVTTVVVIKKRRSRLI